MKDVVVIGAGLAGLTAARELSGADFVVLESDDRVGGRLKSSPRGDYWLNFGAHVFGGPESNVGGLIDEYGLVAQHARGTVTGLAFKGKVLSNGRTETYPFILPLSLRDRGTMIRTGLKIRRSAKAFLAEVALRDGEDPLGPSRRGQRFLNDTTFADFLGPLSPDLDSIFRTISNRAGAPPEDVSAGHGVAAFAIALSKEPMLGRTIIGGSSLLPEAMAAQLGDRLQLGSEVLDVSPTPAGSVSILYRTQGEERRIEARSAIVTTPSYVTHAIVSSLPSDTRSALEQIRYGPSVLMAVLTSERGPMPWDDLYAITVPNSSFNMFFNISHVLRTPGAPRKPGGSLMIYGTGEPGRRLEHASDDEVTDRFLADLHRLFPETRGIVTETVIQRWPAAAPYTFPGRGTLQAALERPVEPVFLAGDYLGTSFTETAVVTARLAARRALDRV